MTEIQKKSLQHISDRLKAFDTYPVYSVLIDKMTKLGIDNETRTDVSNVCQDELSKLSALVRDAQSWVDAILKDSN